MRAAGQIAVLYQDEDLLVVGKPAGLLSVPTPGARGRTLEGALAEQGLAALPVHRLDREVSGLVVLARHEKARAALEQLFRGRAVTKLYWALVRGRIAGERGVFDDSIRDAGAHARIDARGKPALTRWRLLARHAASSAVEVELVTGRYNQIRLHFAHHDHALVGERKYARGKDSPVKFRRVALHARSIRFDHPRTGKALKVRSRMPADLEALLQDLTEV